MTNLSAYITTGAITTEAHYRPKQDQTIIMSKPTDFDDTDNDDDWDNRPIQTRLSGFVVPWVETSTGKVNIIY